MYSSKRKITGAEMDALLKCDREEKEDNEISISLPGNRLKQILNFIMVQRFNTEALEYLFSQLDNGEKIIDYLSKKEQEITSLNEIPERERN